MVTLPINILGFSDHSMSGVGCGGTERIVGGGLLPVEGVRVFDPPAFHTPFK